MFKDCDSKPSSGLCFFLWVQAPPSLFFFPKDLFPAHYDPTILASKVLSRLMMFCLIFFNLLILFVDDFAVCFLPSFRASLEHHSIGQVVLDDPQLLHEVFRFFPKTRIVRMCVRVCVDVYVDTHAHIHIYLCV